MSNLYVDTLSTNDHQVTVDVHDLGALAGLGDPGNPSFYMGRPLRSRLMDFVSVMDYGAKGDGITDDSAAIAAAVASFSAAGGTLFFPGGRSYRMESVVTLNKPIFVRGGGYSNTALTRITSASSQFFNVTAPGCVARDLRMVGIGAAGSTSGQYAITIASSATGFLGEGLTISGVACGVIASGTGFTLRDITASDYKSSVGVGICVDSGVASDAGTITNCTTKCSDGSEPLAGLQVLSGRELSVIDLRTLDCGKGAIIAPPAGKSAIGISLDNSRLGSGNQGGVVLTNSGALGRIERINMSRCNASGSANGSGLQVSTGSIIYGLSANNNEFYSNLNGILVDNNSTIFSMDIDNNKFAGNTTTDIAMGTNVANFRIRGNTTSQGPGLTPSTNGLYISPGCSNFTVTGNTLHQFVDASYPAANVLIEANRGPWGTSSILFDPASIAAGAGFTGSMSCPGARPGDHAVVSYGGALQGIVLSAWVDSADTVGFRLQNGTGGAIDLASGAFRARVIRST